MIRPAAAAPALYCARRALLSSACRPPAGVSSASRHLESGRADERQLRTPNPVTPCSHSLSHSCVSLFLVHGCIWCAHILIPPAADTAGAFAEMNAVVFADAADPFAAAVATSLVNGETGWVGWSASLTPLWCAPSRLRFTGHFSSKFHSQKISKQAMECPGAVLLDFFANFAAVSVFQS